MEYIDGSLLIADKYVVHKGQIVDTLIVTREVWEDPDSKTCLVPFVCAATKVMIIDGKIEIIKFE